MTAARDASSAASPAGTGAGQALRIALIGPAFFGYLDRLAAEMRRLGLAAEAFDELPSNRVPVKLALRLMPAASRAQAVRRHHRALLARLLASRVTHVLLVSVETISRAWVAEVQAQGITVALYAWDSLANKPQMARLASGMTRVASFDPQDCAASGMACLPLFSLAPGGGSPGRAGRPVDFLFCGTLHSDRAAWLERFRRAALAHGHSLEMMAFTPARSLWMLRNLARPRDWRHLQQLRTRSFPAEAVYGAMARAKVVIDLPHPRQSGLTIRCFEAWSQGAVVLRRGDTGFGASSGASLGAGLPGPVRAELAARLVSLERGSDGDLEAAMARALAAPVGPLSAASAEAVGAARFIAQILALLTAE